MSLNTNDLNSIKKLKEQGWAGIDASLEISLFEYGLVWKIEGDEIGFIYRIGKTLTVALSLLAPKLKKNLIGRIGTLFIPI